MKRAMNRICFTCLTLLLSTRNKALAGLGERMGLPRLADLRSWGLWLILGMALLGSFIGPERVLGAVPPSAAFDWTMPDRLIDANSDGLIDGYSGGDHAPADINPDTWQVNLDACSSRPGDSPIVLYRWSLDGTSIGDSTNCNGFSHAFPSEGVYPVTLTVVDEEGNEDTVERDVIVQDWLIVSLGDSFGSGEGNPDRPILPGAYDDLATAYNNFTEAKDGLDAALADQAAVQAAYQPVLDALAVAQSRLATLNARKATRDELCFNPVPILPADIAACADAQAAVVAAETSYAAALVDLGIAWVAAGEADLAQGYDSAAWTYISNVAQAALNTALAAVNLAQAALSIAQAAVTQAQSALAPFCLLPGYFPN
jgi:PKD repeat protein